MDSVSQGDHVFHGYHRTTYRSSGTAGARECGGATRPAMGSGAARSRLRYTTKLPRQLGPQTRGKRIGGCKVLVTGWRIRICTPLRPTFFDRTQVRTMEMRRRREKSQPAPGTSFGRIGPCGHGSSLACLSVWACWPAVGMPPHPAYRLRRPLLGWIPLSPAGQVTLRPQPPRQRPIPHLPRH